MLSFLHKRLNLAVEAPSEIYLAKLIASFIESTVWQNVDIMLYDVDLPPNWTDIKSRVFSGRGGTCLVLNSFFHALLRALGFDAYHSLSKRNGGNATHLIVLVRLSEETYFVDVGDAQPFFEPICLKLNPQVFSSRGLHVASSFKDGIYLLEVTKFEGLNTRYSFTLVEPPLHVIEENAKLHFSHLFYAGLWDNVHLVSFRGNRLNALKGFTLLREVEQSNLEMLEFDDQTRLCEAYQEFFSDSPIAESEFIAAANAHKRIHATRRFGVHLAEGDRDGFLKKLGIGSIEHTLPFLKKFIQAVLGVIPFSNIQMHKRGFGNIPSSEQMKSDVLSFKGGTCVTMNSVLGSLLYSLGFDTFLIHGTMSKPNDHVAISLRLEQHLYIIDLGDGQPYFEPFQVGVFSEFVHPFRTFRTVPLENNKLRIDFLINETWNTDVVFDLRPILFSDVLSTLEQHYTVRDYGPFWANIRFVVYPEQRILAVRGAECIQQKQGSIISRTKYSTTQELSVLLSKVMPEHKTDILEVVDQLNLKHQ